MATTLNSPGVSISITDDSAYASSGQGTIPLFIIGTHEYKATPGGVLAEGTLPKNANKLYLMTSQRDLVQTFGNPVFYKNNGTALDGYELNEYGLHAAYQYLGLANTAYVIRGDIDYSQLLPSAASPRGEPLNGTYWLDTSSSSWGVFLSNGNSSTGLAWENQTPSVISDTSLVEWTIISNKGVDDSNDNIVSQKGNLVLNNTSISLEANDTLSTVASKINSVTKTSNIRADIQYIGGKKTLILKQSQTSSVLDINGSSDSSILSDLGLYIQIYDDKTKTVIDSQNVKEAKLTPVSTMGSNGSFAIVACQNDNVLFQKITNVVASDTTSLNMSGVWFAVENGTSQNIDGNTTTVSPSDWQKALMNCGSDNTKCNISTMSPSFKIPAKSNVGDVWVETNSVNKGMDLALKVYDANTGSWTSLTVMMYPSIDAITTTVSGSVAGIYNIESNIVSFQLVRYNGSMWEALSYQASSNEPTTAPEDGTMWYDSSFKVDIMVNLGGNKWVGYRNHPDLVNTDPNGAIVAGSAPTTQSSGGPLVDNDIWINSSDTENYPMIYRYVSSTSSWKPVDNSDQVTPFGIVFADARQDDGSGNTSGSSLTSSNFLDPDAPNPELYPEGTLLFNTRFGTYNIKQWKSHYFNGGFGKVDYTQNPYTVGVQEYPALTTSGRWVTMSGNNSDGTPVMGRKAQRKLIVEALSSVISGNLDVRSEDIYFNLIAAPGYCELIQPMVELNSDKKQTAFVVGDTPARLSPTGTSITSYTSSSNGGNTETSLVTSDPYLAVYYPWALSDNTDGSEVVVPPSTIAMRTIAYSDSVSYPWYAPAGYTRGLVNNASSVGYINEDGEFTNVLLSEGQRDVLYMNSINPIAYMTGRGLVVYGQKTRNSQKTARDRINVSRLACYLNYQLDALAKPFLFELNNAHTRQSVETTFSKFMADLMMKNAIYDYIVVCDDSNNTSDRIDNNELWIDIAIAPEKAIEFIYIPLRIVNTGTDMSSLYSTTKT